MTRKDFKNSVEGFLIGPMVWYCMAEVAAANDYPDHIQRWRGEVERIISVYISTLHEQMREVFRYTPHRHPKKMSQVSFRPTSVSP